MATSKKEAGMVCALLFGDKSRLSAGTEGNFRQIGASHLLAVSGLHLSTIVQLFTLLLALLHIRGEKASFFHAGRPLLYGRHVFSGLGLP